MNVETDTERLPLRRLTAAIVLQALEDARHDASVRRWLEAGDGSELAQLIGFSRASVSRWVKAQKEIPQMDFGF